MAPRALVLALLAVAAGAASAQAPAWACGQQTDYYAKVTTECAPATCNASQRNLGGDLLVLDIQSYGAKSCQGCNPMIPSTCCKACEDADSCNAWVVCTNKDGCGSGCQAYAKQFKEPLSYADKLPHKFWGNWGSCQGDKWAFGMCSLKVVKDTKNPPVMPDSKPSDGWVSGTVAKPQLDARCPPGTSAKTCKTCLTAKDPALCISCVQSARTLDAAGKCAACASLGSQPGRAACVTCVSGGAAAAANCDRCLDVDCSDADCLNARNSGPAGAPNLGAVDRCFQCQAAAGLGSPKAAGCPNCFDKYTVPEAGRGTCLSCVGGSAAGAAGCAGCAGAKPGDAPACLACLAKAKTPAEGLGCGSCNSARDAAPHVAGCHACVLGSSEENAKSLCSNIESKATPADAAAYFKCLTNAKGPDTPHNCMMCHRMGSPETAAKCYECLGKVDPFKGNGIHCSHCWGASRMAAKAPSGESVAAVCEKCILDKDKAGAAADSCWS